MIHKQLLPIFLSLLILLIHGCTSEKQIQNGWENEYLGTTEGLLFYPDNYANYWVYTFDPGKWENIGFDIRGSLPNARYMSINLYLHDTQQSLGSVVDTALLLDKDSTYHVTVLPNGSTTETTNALFFDPERGRHSLFLRYYDPETPYGQTELPTISAFNLTTGERVDLPHLTFNLMSSQFIPRLATQWIAIRNANSPYYLRGNKALIAYRHSGRGYFPNHDNDYLIVPMEKRKKEVAILRFKAPSFASSRSDSLADMRYWSLAFGSLDTQNPATLRDKDAKVAEDGFVYVAIGDSLQTRDSTAYNLLPWAVSRKKAVLLYRHLLTASTFEQNIGQIPFFRPKTPQSNEVIRYMGEFAPQGFVISREAFEESGFEALRTLN
ncbi:MAG: hypothetical protein NWR72_16335 [Bacteroidia bacterium]|nr:hypothetical protein [Bacteroidia bacterium]